jgi:uncharacterized membrane protein
MRESEIREKLEKQIKIRAFSNTWITVPCFIISTMMLVYQPSILWLILSVFNVVTMLLNWTACRIHYRALQDLQAIEDLKRKKNIDSLYGRNEENT